MEAAKLLTTYHGGQKVLGRKYSGLIHIKTFSTRDSADNWANALRKTGQDCSIGGAYIQKRKGGYIVDIHAYIIYIH
jgi:hypothetical protein